MRLSITFTTWQPNIIQFQIHCIDAAPMNDNRLFMFKNINAVLHQDHLQGRNTYCEGYALSAEHAEQQVSAILTHLSHLLERYGNFCLPVDRDITL